MYSWHLSHGRKNGERNSHKASCTSVLKVCPSSALEQCMADTLLKRIIECTINMGSVHIDVPARSKWETITVPTEVNDTVSCVIDAFD